MHTFDNTQSKLLEAAGQVFSEKGYREATVREICLRAGARNVAAVNYYFRDKEHLYRAVVQQAFRGRFQHLSLPEQWPTSLDAGQKLYVFIRKVVQHLVRDDASPWQSQILLRELARPSESGSALVREFLLPLYQKLWEILRELLPADVAESKLHLIGFSIVGQCIYHSIGRAVIADLVGPEEHEGYDVECLAEHIAHFSLAGLGLTAHAL